ncbi:MAG: hypothetical protein JST92_21320, partial [Deltaproteobacteria bacterium]|nr:hypothetical protein [Deltaproteobacteria bacterium]
IPSAQAVVVSTLAGNGHGGFQDGTGGPTGTASFLDPNGVTVDSAGNVYVGDFGNNRVRKIDPQGNVTTLAGNGQRGDVDGTGGADGTAEFFLPFGVAVDHDGDVFVADTVNLRIRKIDAQGNVTTLAGNGTSGSADGSGGRTGPAQFVGPYGVATDASGDVFVADRDNHRIRKIDPSGTVTTVAGTGFKGSQDGPVSRAQFAGPAGLAVDSSGAIYVADQGNNRIRKIDPAGFVTTVAGGPTYGYYDGAGGAAGCSEFVAPGAIAVGPGGVLYVADTGNHRIREIDATGFVRTLAGTGTAGFADGAGGVAEFWSPSAIASDGKGSLYVVDNGTARVRVIRAGQ